MTKLSFNTQLGIRLLLSLAALMGAMLAFSKDLPYTTTFCLLVAVLCFTELFVFFKQRILFYDKTINAMLHEDFSADLSSYTSAGDHQQLVRLYHTMKSRQNDQASQDLVYRSILNNLETAVMILRQDDHDWTIFFSNDYFTRYFGIPHLSKWKYLKAQLPALCDIVERNDFQDIRTSVQISTESDLKQAFMFQASRTEVFGQVYYIMILDSIQSIVAKKEKDAWINLMKVISHELMNSITPIRSLSQNLNELTRQEPLSAESLEDIRESVGAMIRRSDHLQNFIESYRTLAMLPSPQKEPVPLKTIVDSVLRLMQPLLEEAGVTAENKIATACTVMADTLQLEQVFINLFTNSTYAMAESAIKKIEISVTETADRVFVDVVDTGVGIDKEIEDKVFLPFFTTRKRGAGIGLTLSKNIIEGHGGYLHFKSEENRTCFTVCLIR